MHYELFKFWTVWLSFIQQKINRANGSISGNKIVQLSVYPFNDPCQKFNLSGSLHTLELIVQGRDDRKFKICD
jgi:hypothetical protein